MEEKKVVSIFEKRMNAGLVLTDELLDEIAGDFKNENEAFKKQWTFEQYVHNYMRQIEKKRVRHSV